MYHDSSTSYLCVIYVFICACMQVPIIYVSVYLSIYPSVYLCIYPFSHLCMYLFIHLCISIYLSIGVTIYPSNYQFGYVGFISVSIYVIRSMYLLLYISRSVFFFFSCLPFNQVTTQRTGSRQHRPDIRE